MPDELAYVCGIPGFNGPRPGDPSATTFLTANAVFGGIRLNWNLPAVNPHAIAYVQVFRAANGDFNNAFQTAAASGNTYFDNINVSVETTYYYWIRVVSINGTTSNLVGPASATARPIGTDTLENLTGMIDAGRLSQELNRRIDNISLHYDALVGEIAARVSGNAALAQALADVQAGIQESLALVYQEVITRMEGQDALATQLNTIAAVNGTSAAAILEERTARVSADDALAQSINQNRAATQQAAAAVVSETTARTTADSAITNQVNTLQSSLGSQIASVQQNAQTQINTITGELDAIWTVKVDVNGQVGGFGIYGTASQIEAGFNVDLFWIGRTNASRVKPFIISGGVVYIDKARIRDADIDTLKIAGNSITATSYADAGAGTIGAGTNTAINGIAIDMGYSLTLGTGVIIQGSVTLYPPDGNSSLYLRIYRVRDAAIIAEFPYSLRQGFLDTITVTAWDPLPNQGGNAYHMYLYNPTSGSGSNQQHIVAQSNMIGHAGKR